MIITNDDIFLFNSEEEQINTLLMAKRFISTEIWKEDWFLDMSTEYQLFWLFMLGNCSHSGFYKINFKAFERLYNKPINELDALSNFNNGKDRIRTIDKNTWYVEDFYVFQYGKIFNYKNKLQQSIGDEMLRYNLTPLTIRGLEEVKDGSGTTVWRASKSLDTVLQEGTLTPMREGAKVIINSFTLDNTGEVKNNPVIKENSNLIKMQDENLEIKENNNLNKEEKKSAEKVFPEDELPQPNQHFKNPVPENEKKPRKPRMKNFKSTIGLQPLEACYTEYLESTAGQAASAVICHRQNWREEGLLERWLQAFNRELTSRSEITKSFTEYSTHFGRWVSKVDINNRNPDSIHEQIDRNERTTSQSGGTPGKEKTFGGIKQSEAERFFEDFRKVSERNRGTSTP